MSNLEKSVLGYRLWSVDVNGNNEKRKESSHTR